LLRYCYASACSRLKAIPVHALETVVEFSRLAIDYAMALR
jgi:hypothetical protein